MSNTATAIPPVPLQPEVLTVGSYLERWLRHARARVRPTTADGYHALVHCHAKPALGNLPLDQLHPLHLQDLYSRLLEGTPERRALAAGTVLNLHLLLNQALAQAVRWQLLQSNPAAGAQPPRPRRPTQSVGDPTHLQRLLEALQGHPVELPAAIAIATGMRRGEVAALRWGDLNTEHTLAHVQQSLQSTRAGLVFQQPKTARSRRTVALPEFLQPYLHRQQLAQRERKAAIGDAWKNNDLIIDCGDGGPLNPDTLSSSWRRFLRDRKLPHLRFHDLRHSHATLMLLEGVHPKVVSERLGHASIAITLDLYTHVLPSMQQEAAQAFDRLFPAHPETPTE